MLFNMVSIDVVFVSTTALRSTRAQESTLGLLFSHPIMNLIAVSIANAKYHPYVFYFIFIFACCLVDKCYIIFSLDSEKYFHMPLLPNEFCVDDRSRSTIDL